MDNSSVLVDSSQFRSRVGEVIETSVSIIERGTLTIFKELNRMREDYTGLINKFMDFCEKENITLDINDDGNSNSRSQSIERDRDSISMTNNSRNLNVKQYKFPAFEFKKIKLDKMQNKQRSSNNHMLINMNGQSTPGKNNNSPFTQFNRNANNINTKKRDTRTKTPNKSNLSNFSNISNPNDSSNTLPKIPDMKNLSHNKPNSNNSFNNIHSNNFYGKQANNKKMNTPNNNNKIDLKNFMMFNPQNNYTKKFIKKQSIENLNNIVRKSDKKANENSQTSKINSINNISNNVVVHDSSNRENQVTTNNNNLNINVGNVNINVNNNVNNLSNLNNLNDLTNAVNKGKFDDRKLSILDVGGAGPLIYESEVIPPNNEEKDSSQSLVTYKKTKINKEFLVNLNDKKAKFIYLVAHSDVAPLKIRLMFSKLNKKVYGEYSTKEVVKDYSYILNEKIIRLENALSYYDTIPEIEKILNKPFVPSKTAQNSLNFITKEEEINLTKEDLTGSEEVINIIKIIYILIKQNYEKIDDFSLSSHLINKLMQKLKIDNLSKIKSYLILENLFLNVICHNLLLSNEQYSKLVKIIESNKSVLHSPSIIKVNKTLSYVTFILKEIYDYITIKASDGTLMLNLKKQKIELKKMKEKVEKLNILVSEHK